MAKETEVKDLYDSVKKLSKEYKSLSEGEFVRSGSVVLDAMLGGGIPKGVMIAWASESGCGKSTSALHISRVFCMQGKKVAYLDYEHGVNASQIKGMGLSQYLYDEEKNPTGTFFLWQPVTYKDAEKILDATMENLDLVVIDSVTSILAEKIKEGSAEDVTIGVDARIMAAFLKKYKPDVSRTGCSWIMINQMRTKIATGYGQVTQDKEAGGNALKFYSDVRLMMKKAYKGTLERKEQTAMGEETVPFGSICTLWAEKNRYERPKIPLNLTVLFGKGISNEYSYCDFLMNDGVIKKSGAWYEIKLPGYGDKVNGMSKVIEWISEHREEVKDYINSKGGYRLLLTENNPITISESDGEKVIDEPMISEGDDIIESDIESTEEE